MFLLLKQNVITKNHIWEGRISLAYTSELLFIPYRKQDRSSNRAVSWRHKVMHWPWRGAAYCLASQWLFGLPSCKTQNQQTRDSVFNLGLFLPPLITKWKNDLHLDLMESFPHPSLLLMTLVWVKLTDETIQ